MDKAIELTARRTPDDPSVSGSIPGGPTERAPAPVRYGGTLPRQPMPLFRSDGVALAYDDSGERVLSPVLLLHGLSSARGTWRGVARRLAGRYRVLALDQRGHGESEHAPGSYVLARYGADTIAFCERVVGEPVALVGHSLGGVIAAFVTRRRPDLVLGAFLEDPPLFRGEASQPGEGGLASLFPALREMLRELRRKGAAVSEYEALLNRAPTPGGGSIGDVLGPEGTRAQAEAWASADPEVFTPAIEGTVVAGVEPEATLARPVAIVRGDPARGAAFSAEDEKWFLAANPRASVTLFEATSHGIHDERPERFAAQLESFLAAVCGR